MRKGGTILYIGDSIGWATNTTLTKGIHFFTTQVRNAIRQNYGSCRLINKGIGGSFTQDVLSNISWLFDIEPPDLIIFNIGTNDCAGGGNLTNFQNNLISILDSMKLKFPNAHIILCLPPRSLDANRTPYIQNFRDAMNTIGLSKNVSICHFETAWSTDAGNIEADNIHPNATGHVAMFNVIWSIVQTGSWLSKLTK